MGNRRFEVNDPPIEIPDWYDDLRRRGRDTIEYGLRRRRNSLSWLDIQLDRRGMRRMMTGKIRARSIIQLLFLCLLNLLTVMFAGAYLLVATDNPYMMHRLTHHVSLALMGVLTLTLALSVFWSTLASFLGRTWRYDPPPQTARNWGMYEQNPLTAILGGKIRTRNPIYIGQMIVTSLMLLNPYARFFLKLIQGDDPLTGLEDVKIVAQFFLILFLIVLLLAGIMLLASALLSILALSQAPPDKQDKEADNE